MIYILITTCLIKDNFYNIRENQYKLNIPNIIQRFSNIPNTKIIIIENDNYISKSIKDIIIQLYNQGYISIRINYPTDYEAYSQGYQQFVKGFIDNNFQIY